jgi:glucose/arabinose dehydrogenase
MHRAPTAPRGRRVVIVGAFAASLALLAGCTSGSGPDDKVVGGPGPQPGSPSATVAPGISVVATHLQAPWGLAFLPGGDALVTERDTARILRVSPAGRVQQVQRLAEVDGTGEGGLLGIAVSRTYATDKLVYVYYSTAKDNRIARLRLGERPKPILTGIPVAGNHNGGRLAFGPDGMLYAGTGDATQSDRAQDRSYLGGKILRITPDGKPAPGNPFPGSPVWTYGHRNVQGLAWDDSGRMYASEFGQNTFDELNRIVAGRNYGWPTVEGTGGDARFMEPLTTWPTDQASPSGIAVAAGAVWVACLRGERLWRVPLADDGSVGTPQALLVNRYGRLRNVMVAPDRSLWVFTNNRDGRGTPAADDDKILRLDPQSLAGNGIV